MKKFLSLLAIATLLMMLGSCSKEEKDPDPPVNEEQISTVECEECHALYRVKGKTWSGSASNSKFTQYSGPADGYSVHTIVDEQEDQPVPFEVSKNGQYIKWTCVGEKDGQDCGRVLRFEFSEARPASVAAEGPMPQTREHILL